MSVFDWAFTGQEGNVAKFIHDHPDKLREVNAQGRSLMVCAAAGGNTSVVELIHDFAPDLIDVADNEGMTPVYHAAMKDHVCTMLTLIKHGCNYEKSDFIGRTPLLAAVFFGAKRTVQCLLELKPELSMVSSNNGCLPLHSAVASGNSSALKHLLRIAKTKKNCAMQLAPFPETGETALHIAVKQNKNRCITILLLDDVSKKATMMKDNNGRRPISYALESGNALIIGLLVRHCEIDRALLSY